MARCVGRRLSTLRRPAPRPRAPHEQGAPGGRRAGGERVRVGVATFDAAVQFYSLRAGRAAPAMLIVPDAERPFCPDPASLVAPLRASRLLVRPRPRGQGQACSLWACCAARAGLVGSAKAAPAGAGAGAPGRLLPEARVAGRAPRSAPLADCLPPPGSALRRPGTMIWINCGEPW